MSVVDATLMLIAACIGFALLARELRLPYAVILVLGGMALAFFPGLPEVRLDPELALAFFLPPLLQSSAYRTDWRSFRVNLREILLLAVGCVVFTALCMGTAAKLLLPDLPWVAALAFGAIVAPPDAVAAAAVLQRLRLPRQLVTVLEGESLVNDASALVLYRFAVAAAGTAAVTLWQGVWTLLLPAAGGVVIGWVAGRASAWISARLEDTQLETALSFLACYASFLAAETLHLSGVIAVVTTGFVLGQASHRLLDSRTRLAMRSVWQFVEFILNSLVFILIGLQLNQILRQLQDWPWTVLGGLALTMATILILSRFLWVFAAAGLPRLVPALRQRNPAPPWRMAAVISWAGMRGVVSLAAALALPSDFPDRDLIVFLAFTAILATLVLQGTSLEWLIRRLKMEEPPPDGSFEPEEAEARQAIAQAALQEIERRLDDPLEGAIAADLVSEFRGRAQHLHRTIGSGGAVTAERTARRRLRLLALEAGRARLMELRRQGRLRQEVLARLELELDLEELRIRQVLGDERTEAERQEARRRRRQAAAEQLWQFQ